MSTTTRTTKILAAVTAATALLSLAACSSEDPAASESSATSSGSASGATSNTDSGTLRVASDLTYPPYAYMDNDDPAGFDVDMAKTLADNMGRKAEFVDTRFEQLIPSLNSGRADVIASALYITAERAKQVDYIPYFMTGNSIVVTQDGPDLQTVTDLCGLKVGAIKGGDIVDQLRNDGSDQCGSKGKDAIDVREFPTDPEATQALISGQIDAQVDDAAVATTLGKNADVSIKITSDELLYPIPVGLAVKKGNTKLESDIKKALEDMKADGSYAKLLKQYNLKEPDAAAVQQALGD
jgi:ABC-type amino acid transport substrate-binding protein